MSAIGPHICEGRGTCKHCGGPTPTVERTEATFDAVKLSTESMAKFEAQKYAATTLAQDKEAVAHDYEMGFMAAFAMLRRTEQAEGREITDEMVKRAAMSIMGVTLESWPFQDSRDIAYRLKQAREALEVALYG